MRYLQGMLAAALLLSAWGALAQAVVPPATAEPGRLRERFDAPPSAPVDAQLPELKGATEAVLPEAVRALRVTLRAIRVEGSTVYTPAQWQVQTGAYLGREISGSDIFALAQALTVQYRNDGYFLSVVIVPPQSLADGTLTLRAVEGYVASVRIEGDPRVRPQLEEIAAKIQASRPLSAQVLERYLLIANDFPGVQLRSVLSPSQTVGAADLTLIASVKDVEGFASIDNYGTRYLGPNQATVGITGNQLLGVNDQWRFIGAGTGNTQMSFAQLSYSQVLNGEGLALGLSASQARTQPGDTLRAFDVRGYSDAFALTLSSPWLRTRNHSLLARVTYDQADIRSEILGARVSDDKIRALRTGLTWRRLDALDGQNNLDVDFSRGLGGTQGGDALKSRVGADGHFSKLTFDYARYQPLGGRWGLTTGLAGQWTADTPLLSSEQFALGGRRYGRAYEAAELVGDRGFALRLEPRYAVPVGGNGLRSYHLFSFYDIGEVSKVGNQSASTPVSQSLASAGFGTRLFMAGPATAQFEAAWPLTKPVASLPDDGKAVRLLASLLIQF
ncbi:MAG: ShlB/FhaC/HecB family hemolysin secretion/activation protein [Burkholderiales bacterium]|nr:ShlB/FhaC/HecB family hemolysin secretion/activation protein [Burkholderiales bacterium]